MGKGLSIICLLFLSLMVKAETFTSAEIISRSVSKNCLDWKVIGICYWLKCSPKCRIKTSPKIQHNLPDLVATVYPYESPWLEMRLSAVSNIYDSVISGGDASRQQRQSHQVKFREVEVIGNPAARFRNIFGVSFLCKSQTQPLHRYFSSQNTPQNIIPWRGEGFDITKSESWIPGLREIGTWPTNTWGSVYPRTGFIQQSEDPKAAAVLAQRAIDIVTRGGQGFTYTPLGHTGYRPYLWGNPRATSSKDCKETGGRWQPPNPISGSSRGVCLTQRSVQWMPPSNEKTDRWQMISPIANQQCETFGSAGPWSDGKESSDGNYAFNYWRKYKCCIPRSGRYIGSTEF